MWGHQGHRATYCVRHWISIWASMHVSVCFITYQCLRHCRSMCATLYWIAFKCTSLFASMCVTLYFNVFQCALVVVGWVRQSLFAWTFVTGRTHHHHCCYTLHRYHHHHWCYHHCHLGCHKTGEPGNGALYLSLWSFDGAIALSIEHWEDKLASHLSGVNLNT